MDAVVTNVNKVSVMGIRDAQSPWGKERGKRREEVESGLYRSTELQSTDRGATID